MKLKVKCIEPIRTVFSLEDNIVFEKNIIYDILVQNDGVKLLISDQDETCFSHLYDMNFINKHFEPLPTLDNYDYVKEASDAFPEVIEALRMVLHDCMTHEQRDNAEIILSRYYKILGKYDIKVPKI